MFGNAEVQSTLGRPNISVLLVFSYQENIVTQFYRENLQKMLITFIFLPLGPKIRMMKFDSFSMISTFT